MCHIQTRIVGFIYLFSRRMDGGKKIVVVGLKWTQLPVVGCIFHDVYTTTTTTRFGHEEK
jgi:hypothetical protein